MPATPHATKQDFELAFKGFHYPISRAAIINMGRDKGGIDREKRDTAISAWVTRQHKVRGAQTARPTIREYYAEDAAEWPQRSVYPPASAR